MNVLRNGQDGKKTDLRKEHKTSLGMDKRGETNVFRNGERGSRQI